MPTDKKPDPQPEKKSWRVADVAQREHFTMLEPMEPVNLTEEQKAWRVVELVQRERFTMLEPMEPNNLTPEETGWPVVKLEDVMVPERFTMLEPKEPNNLSDEQKSWPVAEGRETAPEVGASDLATIRGLIDRYGAHRLRQIIGSIVAGDIESR